MTRLKVFLDLIKFEHSLFALPFAYLGLFLAAGGWPGGRTFLWVTAAMVAIRTAGMSLNRLIDEPIDGRNPRTSGRAASIRIVTRPVVWSIVAFSLALFVLSAANLNRLCLALSPIPIVLVWMYPFLKRITWLSHFILGTILGIAPYGGWLAGSGTWSWTPFLLALAVGLWVSGFDMLYALQDVSFDRERGLHSFPARFGVKGTVAVAFLLHGITVVLLGGAGWSAALGLWYWIGLAVVSGLIVREHLLVHRFGLEKINEAFFNMNAMVSVVIFIATVLALTIG